MKIILSKHASDKKILQGITTDELKRCIKRGGKVRQTDGLLASYTYFKVAYKKLSDDVYFIKTIYTKKWTLAYVRNVMGN